MEKLNPEKIKSFLPSKKFAVVLGFCCGTILILLIIGSLFGSHSFFNPKSGPLVEANGTINELLVQDSNNNGIPDWEESLWGLDPKGDGAANKKIVDEKKAEANIAPDMEGAPVNETDKFSQSLLSTILALNQSGSLNTASLTKLSESISDTVDVKHVDIAPYTLDDLTIVPATRASKLAYKNALKKILDQYSDLDLGSEVSYIYQGVTPGGQDGLKQLTPYAKAYADISEKMLKLKTPDNIDLVALDIINTSDAMSRSIPLIQNLYTDAVSGVVGVGDYIKASKISDAATGKMKTYFSY